MSSKRRFQYWEATSKFLLLLVFIFSIAYCLGVLTGFFWAPKKVEYIPVDDEQILTASVIQNEGPHLEKENLPEVIPAETAASRYSLTDNERDLVERVVMAEAAGEGFDGQRLVAQCILNTAEAMGIRPDEVVLAKNQYASPAEEASQEVKDAVSAVFDDGEMATDEPIRFFYAPKYVTSEWHESKVFILEHGGHRFFKEG